MSELIVKKKVVVPSEIFGNLTIIDGEQGLFFIGKEVAEMLGYSNTSKAVASHCKKTQILTSQNGTLELNIPNRGLTVIPESDVYRLIIRSKLPSSERFEEWVMEEVLPQIRKNGSYVSQPTLPQTFSEALRLLADSEDEKQVLQLEVSTQSIKIEEDAPKIEIYNDLVATEELISMSVACKALDVGLRNMYGFLRDCKIISSKRGSSYNIPYQSYIDRGYFVVKTKPYPNPHTGKEGIDFTAYITGSGMIWLEKYLNKNY